MAGVAITLDKSEVQAVATDMTMREYLQLVLDKESDGVIKLFPDEEESPSDPH